MIKYKTQKQAKKKRLALKAKQGIKLKLSSPRAKSPTQPLTRTQSSP